MARDISLPRALDQVPLPDPLPPVVLVAFTRPDLLQQVLAALVQQTHRPPGLIAFVDGARTTADGPAIAHCCQLLADFDTHIPTKIVQRDRNLGCDQNVIQGLTEVLSTHPTAVYLEDDTVPTPPFYDRMCRLLAAYQDHPQVGSVSAYATYPGDFVLPADADFIVSQRVFCWGLGLWADRWHALDLLHQPDQYNPFGCFYHIPPTPQTKLTLTNQFWLEKNRQSDWMITFTLATLHRQQVHLVPTRSFIRNIGFGHPEAKTYRGEEPAWVNAHYDAEAYPNRLPAHLDLLPPLGRLLSDGERVQHLAQNGIWLNFQALGALLGQAQSWRGRWQVVGLFVRQFPRLVGRWRNGLPG